MKRNLILFISLFILSCTSEKQQSLSILCPELFFSKDHRLYISSEENSLTLNNISYKAEINNYKFVNKCSILNNKIIAKLSILFVVRPENAKQSKITLPYYIAFLDNQKNILNIQYYKVTGTLKKNNDKSSYIETEITATSDIIFPIKDINIDINNKFLIGFMLNKEKLKILN